MSICWRKRFAFPIKWAARCAIYIHTFFHSCRSHHINNEFIDKSNWLALNISYILFSCKHSSEPCFQCQNMLKHRMLYGGIKYGQKKIFVNAQQQHWEHWETSHVFVKHSTEQEEINARFERKNVCWLTNFN